MGTTGTTGSAYYDHLAEHALDSKVVIDHLEKEIAKFEALLRDKPLLRYPRIVLRGLCHDLSLEKDVLEACLNEIATGGYPVG